MSSDLSAILGTRASPPSPTSGRQRSGRHRWLALVVIVLIALFAALTWRRWIPRTAVDVARIEAVAADGAVANPGQVAFQAAGWIEAAPFAVEVSALINGIVAEVPVLAGQAVGQGAVVARLVDDEQRLAVAAAEAAVARSKAALSLAEARVTAAEAESARLPARLAAATAERDERRDRAKRLEASGAAVAIGTSEQAALQASAAEHHLADLHGSAPVLDAAIAAARAEVAERTAALTAAGVELAQAALALERTVIRTPSAGTIQRLHVRPGSKLMIDGDHPHSATAAELFDPARLQVRVDVALSDVGRLAIGQPARVTCEALGERTLAGSVTRIDGMADVARNTLQAKVALSAGDPALRPEMLCRVQFLGNGKPSHDGAGRVRLLLPASVVGGATGTRHELWTVDGDERARRVRVTLGDRSGDLVEVVDGLGAGAWVIRDPPATLAEGERVRAKESP